jgi:hypothetical protein
LTSWASDRPRTVASANVDSEFRFYAAWYVVLGALVLKAARRPETETMIVRASAAGFLLGALGRAASIKSLGKPHPIIRLLMALELGIPVVVPWQNRVARAAARDR